MQLRVLALMMDYNVDNNALSRFQATHEAGSWGFDLDVDSNSDFDTETSPRGARRKKRPTPLGLNVGSLLARFGGLGNLITKFEEFLLKVKAARLAQQNIRLFA